jgi:hypothetical protein
MALSVKRFIHEVNCPEPTEQTNVMYHPTSSDVLCNGGGTLTAIFADQNGLTNIQANESTTYAGDGDLCANGMDVVFVVDYTGSMGGAIDGVKNGLNSLISTINTQSGGNYRLGLVAFDGGTCFYNTSSYYNALPAAQKINEECATIITCFEKMGTVGNSTSFSTAVNSINNPSTGMPIGSSKEWGGRAIDEIVNSNFAGSFRNNVQKLIILVTDDDPENNIAYFNNLFANFDGEGFQLLYNSSQAVDSTAHNEYNILLNTQPAGSAHYGLNYNSTWTTGLIADIENLCEETFTYTCDEIAVGWYMEPGNNTAFYWDGSVWTTANCSYTVKVNISKASGSSANWNLASIPASHPNYFDANTFIFTGTYNQLYQILSWEAVPITDYTVNDIVSVTETTVSGDGAMFNVFTDNGVGDSQTDALLGNTIFAFAGYITGDAEYNIVIGAKVAANNYTMRVNVIADEPDILDSDSVSQSPSGAINVVGTDPVNFWLPEASSYPTKTGATGYAFSGVVGSSHNFELALSPVPSDYTIDVTGYTDTYSNTPSQNAIGPNIVVNDTSVSGSFTMPSGGGLAEIFLAGQVNQPNYRFDLSVTDSITGVSVVTGDQSQAYVGYTGDTFDWAADLIAGTDTESFTINYGSNTANPSTYVSISSGAGAGHDVYGVVTMPASGGSSTVTVAGSSVAATYDMDITFTDNFEGEETYGDPITVTGTAGQTINTTKTLTGASSDISYSITKTTSDNTDVSILTTGTTLNIKTVMPSGGGSAAIDVEGTSSVNSYSYTTTFRIPTKHSSSTYGWKSTTNNDINTEITEVAVTVTGNAGDVISIAPPIALVTAQDYYRVTPTTSTSLNPEITNEGGTNGSFTGGTNTIQHAYTPSCTLTMPSGGGSATIDTYMTTAVKSHSFSLVVSTDSGSSGVTATSPTCSTDPLGVSRGAITSGAQTITFASSTGVTMSTIQVPVRPNNTTDYDNEINSFTVAPASITGITTVVERNNYCGANVEYADIDFTMPSLDPRFGLTINSGTIVVDDTVSAISRSFTLNYTDSISNAGPARASDTFTGGVGTTHNYSIVYSASSGYTLALSGATDNSGAVTVARSGNTVSGVVTMPSGGGSATVTATGTSTQIKYDYVVSLSEIISNASIVGANADGNKTLAVSLAPGATHTFTEAISVTSGYYWAAGPTISDNQNHAASSVNSSGAISITVTGGSANRFADVLMGGRTSIITRNLTVSYSDNNLGGIISSGKGAGYTSWAQDVFNGAPGTAGTKKLYFMPASGYVDANINGISSTNSELASGTHLPIIEANAGEEWQLSYTIPNTNSNVTITIDGGSVQATLATDATTLATAATTLATDATTKATAATTLATDATTQATKPTLATTTTTKDNTVYYFAECEDCDGRPAGMYRDTQMIERSLTYSTNNFEALTVRGCGANGIGGVDDPYDFIITGLSECDGGGEGPGEGEDPKDPGKGGGLEEGGPE